VFAVYARKVAHPKFLEEDVRSRWGKMYLGFGVISNPIK